MSLAPAVIMFCHLPHFGKYWLEIFNYNSLNWIGSWIIENWIKAGADLLQCQYVYTGVSLVLSLASSFPPSISFFPSLSLWFFIFLLWLMHEDYSKPYFCYSFKKEFTCFNRVTGSVVTHYPVNQILLWDPRISNLPLSFIHFRLCHLLFKMLLVLFLSLLLITFKVGF